MGEQLRNAARQCWTFLKHHVAGGARPSVDQVIHRQNAARLRHFAGREGRLDRETNWNRKLLGKVEIDRKQRRAGMQDIHMRVDVGNIDTPRQGGSDLGATFSTDIFCILLTKGKRSSGWEEAASIA